MSYEYFAGVSPESSIPLIKLFDSSDVSLLAEVLSAAPSEVLLRWLDLPKRSEWPEDITVVRQPDGLLISFYSGTAARRDEFLAYLRMRLAQDAQVFVEFEEV